MNCSAENIPKFSSLSTKAMTPTGSWAIRRGKPAHACLRVLVFVALPAPSASVPLPLLQASSTLNIFQRNSLTTLSQHSIPSFPALLLFVALTICSGHDDYLFHFEFALAHLNRNSAKSRLFTCLGFGSIPSTYNCQKNRVNAY